MQHCGAEDEHGAAPAIGVYEPLQQQRPDDLTHRRADHRDRSGDRSVTVEVLLNDHHSRQVDHAQPDACNSPAVAVMLSCDTDYCSAVTRILGHMVNGC